MLAPALNMITTVRHWLPVAGFRPPPGERLVDRHGHRCMWRNAARASRYQGHVVSRPTCLAPTRAPPLSASALCSWQPTTLLEKAFLGGTSAAQALADPRNARAVGVVGETTGFLALRRMRRRMERHVNDPALEPGLAARSWSAAHACEPCLGQPIGRAVLHDQPLISSETMPLAYLESLPAESFGASYGRSNPHHPNPDRSLTSTLTGTHPNFNLDGSSNFNLPTILQSRP